MTQLVTVLCFDCGKTFKVPYGTPNPTKKCPNCVHKSDEKCYYCDKKAEYNDIASVGDEHFFVGVCFTHIQKMISA